MSANVRDAVKSLSAKCVFQYHENIWGDDLVISIEAHDGCISFDIDEMSVIFVASECGDVAKNLFKAAAILADQQRGDNYLDLGAKIDSETRARTFLITSALPSEVFFHMAAWSAENRSSDFSASAYFGDPDLCDEPRTNDKRQFVLSIAIERGYVQLIIDNFEFSLDLEQARWLADNLWKAAYLMADELRDYDVEQMA
ncbi:hypothetical protein [Pseudomonas veronii]